MNNSRLLNAFCGVLLAVAPLSGLQAKQLTPDEALARLRTADSQWRIQSHSVFNLSLTESVADQALVYVFNKGENGFVVLGGDDRMPVLLGYSETGNIGEDNVSPSFKWWISQYAEETATAFAKEDSDYETVIYATRANDDREKIPYLISTKWGQTNPYNLDCPKLNERSCVTGCVATAMAQIIRYHKYPETGFSSNAYVLENANIWGPDSLISFDFEASSFNYDEMLDTYDSSASIDQKNSVANLMYACGVSVNMEYNTTESGASDSYIAYALRNYFKYDNNVRLMKKNFFSADEWEELIYSEIKENRPVLMGGQAPGGGHQFVCDGYDGDGYFHINWGWEGLADGYFLLSALNPPVQGTGGHNGGYNSNQSATIGIQPPVEGTPVWYPIYSNGSIEASNPRKNGIDVQFQNVRGTGLFNYSQENVSVGLLLKAVASDGKEYFSEAEPFDFAGASGLSLSGYNKLGTMPLPSGLTAGDYKCYLMLQSSDGNRQEIMFPYTSIAYFNLNVSESGNMTCSAGEPRAKAEIRVSEFNPTGEIIVDTPTRFDITIDNIGEVEYSGSISYYLYPHGSDKPVSYATVTLNSIAPGKSFSGYLNVQIPTAGTFDIVFFNQSGERISDTFTVTVVESAVDSILEVNSTADIYSPAGVLIRRNVTKDFIQSLPKGIYIIKSNDISTTVIK